MKPVFLNQDTRYGRALFSIEDGHLCVATGTRSSRREIRCLLSAIDPRIERKRQRFVRPAIKGLVTAAGIAVLVHLLVDRLKFVDGLLEAPVVVMYGYLFGGVLVGALVFYSVIGFLAVDVVECRSMDGTFAVRLFQTKKQRQLVEDFVAELLRAVNAASKEGGPNKRVEAISGTRPEV